MRADHGLVDIRHVLLEVRDDSIKMRRHRVADGVGDVDRRRAGVDRFFDDFGKEIEFRAGGVFRREFDVVAKRLRPLDVLHGRADDFLLRHLELELAMNRAGGEEDVNPPFLGAARALPRPGRCLPCGSGPARRSPSGRRIGRRRAFTASKSPGEAIGNPASMTSTPSSVSASATSAFQRRSCCSRGTARRRARWCRRW